MEGSENVKGRGEGPVGGVRRRSRSFCFLERAGESWTVFLVTYQKGGRDWRGYFSFRPASGGHAVEAEIRTADLFVEPSESDVDVRARGLGRPLVSALLESALHIHERRWGFTADAREWFREFLARQVVREREAEPGEHEAGVETDLTLARLRSLYDSYRLDQVSHLIALLDRDHFGQLVDRILSGREIDFRVRDRLQLALLVVEELERLLPLPPFQLWVEDYAASRREYQAYTHALHREGRLP